MFIIIANKEFKQLKYIILLVILPLILGGFLYLALDSQVIFLKPLGFKTSIYTHNTFLLFIRYYLMDSLWAFSLTSMILIISNNDINNGVLLILISIFLSTLELGQKIGWIPGTCDLLDIIIEIISEIIAFTICLHITKEEKRYEK